MAETTNGSLQQNQVLLQSLFHALDPISLVLSQNSNPNDAPVPLRLTTESFFMERGPRYNEYAELRESRLRKKNMRQQQVKIEEEEEDYASYENREDSEPKQSPLKKQVRFQGNFTNSRKGSSVSSVLAQSVPDFSATLRKENRKPPPSSSSRLELTPPTKNWSKTNVGLSNSRGSRSASAGEKKGMIARKSYASIDELKGLSVGVAKDICGENRGRNGRGGVSKSILGHRQF